MEYNFFQKCAEYVFSITFEIEKYDQNCTKREENMPKVSVIMPSLNVAPYIKECIDSVICQTMHDIEVLCVDAGSTDGTRKILEEYAQKDPRIRVLHSVKKSYGYQMNLGIRESTGEYIGIVETDDYILSDMYEELYAYAKEHDADFVKSDFDIFTTLHSRQRIFLRYSLKKHSSARYNKLFTWEDYLDDQKNVDIFIWNGIYKKSFLLENHILFQETAGAAFQDCGFRYQVAFYVKRGFFIERSFYRYRRDNVNSSTYNSKCVLFNLAECKNLIHLVQERGLTDKRRWEFLAREIMGIAIGSYMELLTWGKSDSHTSEALDEFRDILRDFIKSGILTRSSVTEALWTELRMFVENSDFYNYYAHLKAEVTSETIHQFLEVLSAQKQIILFGSGQVGSSAYCLIRSNGIDHITAFCDNDSKKWNQTYMGCKILSPEEAVKRFPNAYFLITNAAHTSEIKEQLYSYGVSRQQVAIYEQSTFPLHCMHKAIQSDVKEL